MLHFKKGFSLCFNRLSCSDSQPTSWYNGCNETKMIAPVTIRAVSFWILSNSCFSYWVHFSQMVSPYSSIGRMHEKYIVSKGFLSRINFNLRIIFYYLPSFFFIIIVYMRIPRVIMRKYYTQVFMWDDFCYLMISHIYWGMIWPIQFSWNSERFGFQRVKFN